MGMLSNKYPDVQSVESALNNGTDAYSSTQALTEQVSALEGGGKRNKGRFKQII